jgi:hypothetical protein
MHWTGEWVDFIASLDVYPNRESKPGFPAQSRMEKEEEDKKKRKKKECHSPKCF